MIIASLPFCEATDDRRRRCQRAEDERADGPDTYKNIQIHVCKARCSSRWCNAISHRGRMAEKFYRSKLLKKCVEEEKKKIKP